MGDAGRRRGRTGVDVIGAAVTALVVFLAVPSVLVLVVGNPLRGGLGHAWPQVSRDVLCAAVAAAWVAWAACSAQLVRGVVAHVRRGETPAEGVTVLDRLAARIAVGILAMSSVGVAAPVVLTSAAGASAPVATAAIGASTVSGRVTEPAGPQGTDQALDAAHTVAVVEAVHVVRDGESLWRIARERLDDDADWAALAALNLGTAMPDGTRFVDPDQLRAGWRLRLPPGVREAAGPRATPVAPSGGRLDARLPELVALGAGSLTCAALARRARRRRQQAGRLVDPDLLPVDQRLEPLSTGAADTAALLGRFDGVPSLGAFEAANVLLAQSAGRDGTHPSVRTICVGPDGVTFWLRARAAVAPAGFEPLEDGAAWHVDHRLLQDPEPGPPYVPVALPVGDDEQGTWLLALEPGDVVPLLGPSAAALWRSARAALESWAWADALVLAERVDDPRLDVAPSADPATMRRVVFFGHPASLAPALAHRASIVTTDAVAGSDLSVLVDERAATIHPTGRVVRPHLMTAAVQLHLGEMVDGTPPDAVSEPAGPRSIPPVRPPAAPAAPAAHAPSTDAFPMDALRMNALRIDPGTVDVRLLTMTPRLDGLCEDLPPNRARRAVELVAYLALHHPDVITGDRLRTRVLGSADADAAAKTLFNTAHAARRAMGLDERGDPLFPAGSRTGLYQVSPSVTVDVQRAIELVRLGQACDEADLVIAAYRGALELVEGEPLANALSGYTWWEAEGHAGRVAAVLVDAACSLVRLCADRGLMELARWGLGRARLVAPYSEALSRAAMELAAAEGDADRLRTEWRECQRMVDALDPGGSPSQRTEALYGELTRRMVVPAGLRPGAGQAWGAAAVTSDWTPAAAP